MVYLKIIKNIDGLGYKVGETRVVSNTFGEILATQFPEFVEIIKTKQMDYYSNKMLSRYNYETK